MKQMKIQAKPSIRAEVVTRRTYNRPLDETGTVFESWQQTVSRVVDHQKWLWERAVSRKLNKKELEELAQFEELMLARKALVSGRTLWLGGTDVAKKRESSMFNPLPSYTKFITKEGVKSFDECLDGSLHQVITHLGNWKEGTVMFAGERDMVSIGLQRGRSSTVIDSCVDHTWIKNDGSRVVASDLDVGDTIYAAPEDNFNSWVFDDAPVDEQYWWCFGFVYGDGALAKSTAGYTSRVRLCGKKANFLDRFTGCDFAHSFPPSCDDDPIVYTGNYQKSLPSEDSDPRLIKAFLMGYLDADGQKRVQRGRKTFKTLSTTSKDAMEFVSRWLPTFGVYILKTESQNLKTNYGTFDGWRLSFTTYDQNGGHQWRVKSVVPTDRQECYCLTVEDDHSFVLPNGIVSGNCSFTQVETVYDVVDCLWLLLQGCGVGFTPVRGTLNGFLRPIKTIEVIKSTRTEKGGNEYNTETWDPTTKTWTITIGDSAESWAKSIGKLLAGKFAANKLVLDFSAIRPSGERLKGYGWISSGDDAISKAYVAIAELMNRRAGSLLTAIDILDIMNHLGTVLSSRRSAEIALLRADDPEWKEFATAKKDMWDHGNGHREQSNNSLVFYSKPTKERLQEIFALIINAGGSEPGFINGEAALKRAPWFKGCNPCLTGNTLVSIAGRGFVRIETLAGSDHPVFDQDGNEVMSEFKMTSPSAEIFEVELSNGAIIEATEYHNFVLADGGKRQLKDLVFGDELMVANVSNQFGAIDDPKRAYVDAWMIADGTWYNNSNSSKLYIYNPKEDHIPALEACGLSFRKDGEDRYLAQCAGRILPDKTKVPDYVLQGNKDTVLAFIKGSIESDGTICESKNGWMIQFTSCERSFLQDLQALLRLIDVRAHISVGREAGLRMMPDGNGGSKEYECRKTWRLTVSNPLSIMVHLYPELVKRGPYSITEKVSVKNVTKTRQYKAVYCAGVPTTNSFALPWIISGNCAEILLGNKSFCNLTEVDIGKFHGDSSGLRDAIAIAARANYRQTCVNLKDGVLQEAWHLNNEFLRLCGVGLTGIARRNDLGAYDYQELQRVATSAAFAMADELGTAHPKNVTTVKPSGTLSKIMDTTEGVHKPLGRYVFNNINFSKHDPIVKSLKAAGYKVIPNPADPESMLVTFPVAWDDVEFTNVDGVEINIESAVSQLDKYKLLQNNWTQQNTSVTISYDPYEVPSIIDWLLINWDLYVGVSFIYRTDPTKTAADLGYKYLPQEIVTKATYDKYIACIVDIDVDADNSFEEITDADCIMGVCPVK